MPIEPVSVKRMKTLLASILCARRSSFFAALAVAGAARQEQREQDRECSHGDTERGRSRFRKPCRGLALRGPARTFGQVRVDVCPVFGVVGYGDQSCRELARTHDQPGRRRIARRGRSVRIRHRRRHHRRARRRRRHRRGQRRRRHRARAPRRPRGGPRRRARRRARRSGAATAVASRARSAARAGSAGRRSAGRRPPARSPHRPRAIRRRPTPNLAPRGRARAAVPLRAAPPPATGEAHAHGARASSGRRARRRARRRGRRPSRVRAPWTSSSTRSRTWPAAVDETLAPVTGLLPRCPTARAGAGSRAARGCGRGTRRRRRRRGCGGRTRA